ncbi:MAG: hypothetical protein L0Z62_41080 [Gemmataceae bacterium]|nr:hypothetical protein [Gemmataceae bacterium]
MNLGKPPQWLSDLLPDEVRNFLEGGGWWLVLGVLALLILLLLWTLVRGLFAGKPAPVRRSADLEEDLESIGPAPPHSGDRKLTIEGVPVRLRLVVLAPAGDVMQVRAERAGEVLNRVVQGLADIVERDQPLVRVWPRQLSYEGFATSFHRNTPVPEGEKNPSRWILLAGRADLGGRQVLIGLALQAVKPTTIGRKTLKPHQWDTLLRLKVMD